MTASNKAESSEKQPRQERVYIEEDSPCYWEGDNLVHVLPGCRCDEDDQQEDTLGIIGSPRRFGSFS